MQRFFFLWYHRFITTKASPFMSTLQMEHKHDFDRLFVAPTSSRTVWAVVSSKSGENSNGWHSGRNEWMSLSSSSPGLPRPRGVGMSLKAKRSAIADSGRLWNNGCQNLLPQRVHQRWGPIPAGRRAGQPTCWCRRGKSRCHQTPAKDKQHQH